MRQIVERDNSDLIIMKVMTFIYELDNRKESGE